MHIAELHIANFALFCLTLPETSMIIIIIIQELQIN